MATAARRIEVIKNHIKEFNLTKNNTKSIKYKYTLDNAKLSQYQRDFYESNGYLVIKKLIPYDIIDKCRNRFLDICNGIVDKGTMTLMKEILMMKSTVKGEYLYFKVQDIVHDEIFSLYTEHPELLEYVKCFTGENIMAMNSMLINKPPGSSNHPPHQDLHYFPFRPADRIVGSWTAMEPVFEENGCLYVVPGSHKSELCYHSYPKGPNSVVNKVIHAIQDSEKIAPTEKRVRLPMETGDTVFFHPLLIHGSGPNRSSKFRKALSCHYASSYCHYINTDGTSQEYVAREVEEIAERRGFFKDFKAFWFIKGKCVQGERINM